MWQSFLLVRWWNHLCGWRLRILFRLCQFMSARRFWLLCGMQSWTCNRWICVPLQRWLPNWLSMSPLSVSGLHNSLGDNDKCDTILSWHWCGSTVSTGMLSRAFFVCRRLPRSSLLWSRVWLRIKWMHQFVPMPQWLSVGMWRLSKPDLHVRWSR